jgi:hypothetical protein
MALEPSVAGPQTSSAVTAEPAPAVAPPVFDDAQRALLRDVLNRIVPANPALALAAAGDLDVGAIIERTLSESPRLRRLFLDGLVRIAITASRSTGAEFVALDPGRQTAVLEAVEQSSPAFFTALVEHTYRGYYTHSLVQRALGVRPPQPIGYELPPFDPAILDRQRQRAPFWRSVS